MLEARAGGGGDRILTQPSTATLTPSFSKSPGAVVFSIVSLVVGEKPSQRSKAGLSLAILAVDQCHRNPYLTHAVLWVWHLGCKSNKTQENGTLIPSLDRLES